MFDKLTKDMLDLVVVEKGAGKGRFAILISDGGGCCSVIFACCCRSGGSKPK